MSSKRSLLSEVSSRPANSALSAADEPREPVRPTVKGAKAISPEVMDALRGGSSNPRGGPLWMRNCQLCKDVMSECRLELKCPAITTKIDEYLMKNHTKEAPDSSDVSRVIRELAEKGDLRAKQVHGPAGPRKHAVDQFVMQWKGILAIQQYLESKSDFPLQTAEERTKFDEGLREMVKLEDVNNGVCDPAMQLRVRKQQRFVCGFKSWLESMDPDEKKKLKQAGGMNVASFFLDKFFNDGAGSLDDTGPKKITAQDRKAFSQVLSLYVERQGVGV